MESSRQKVTVGPQNVLTQAERYSRGARDTEFDFDGFRVPFVYSTNGEVFWFQRRSPPPQPLASGRGFPHPERLQGGAHPRLRRGLREARWPSARPPESCPVPEGSKRGRSTERLPRRKRNLLVAMATGTGKTFTLVNQIYRLMKVGVARRVRVLVHRRALAAQAVRAFSAFEAKPGTKFDHLYEVYSSRFQTEDFGEEEKFDPKILQKEYLTDPKPGLTFVYVCTIQLMAISILGKNAIPGLGEEDIDPDVEQLDIPIHAFDPSSPTSAIAGTRHRSSRCGARR